MVTFRFDVFDGVTNPVKGMMAAFRSANQPLAGFRSGLASLVPVMNRVQGESRETSMGVSGMGNMFAGLRGMLGTAVLVDGIRRVGTAVWDVTGKASDLSESVNKAQIVFGQQFSGIKKFAEGAADSIGLSEGQALAAAGTFGSMFKGLGIQGPIVQSMSKQVLQLGADLASFNNLDVNESLDALLSGLKGESEPLMRQFGIVLDEATLKQKAMDMGLVSSTKGTLPAAIRTQAIYAAILERTKDAQGDFARTSDGLANSTRILKAGWQDITTTLGNFFVPIASEAVGWLRGLVSWAKQSGGGFSDWFEGLRAHAAEMRPYLMGFFGAFKELAMALWPVFQKVGQVLGTILVPIIKGAWELVTKLFHGIADWVGKNEGAIMSAIDGIGNFVRVTIGAAVGMFEFYGNIIGKVWSDAQAFVGWFRENNPLAVLGRLFPNVSRGFTLLKDQIKQDFSDVFNWVWETFFKPVSKAFEMLFGAFGKKFDMIGAQTGAQMPIPDYSGYLNVGVGKKTDGDANGGTAGLLGNLNSQFGAPTGGSDGGSKKKGKSHISEGLSSVQGGGGNVKHITINIGKQVEKLEFHTTNLGVGMNQIKSNLERLLLDVVNDVSYQ